MRRYRSTYRYGLLFVVICNILTTLGPRFLERAIDELTRSAPLRRGRLERDADGDRGRGGRCWRGTACANA